MTNYVYYSRSGHDDEQKPAHNVSRKLRKEDCPVEKLGVGVLKVFHNCVETCPNYNLLDDQQHRHFHKLFDKVGKCFYPDKAQFRRES